MKKKLEEVLELYQQFQHSGQSLYQDFEDLQYNFAKEFREQVPQEIIYADFSTYTAYTYGLSSGGIIQKLEDPLERYKTREWLQKSFFEWFPKYRFIERYQLNEYKTLDKELELINELRKKLIELIDLKDKE
ncbi:YxiJ family protein [Paenibacillus tundrae]|uniref:YxiJ family protein n=1 Tax=Paenibacillus tundrae TaxID=528187 RepID=UPI0030CECE20